MKTVISNTGDFVREAEITVVSGIADTYNLQFTSQLRSAKNAEERQRNFSLILNRDELTSLNMLISEVLKGR